MPACNLLRVKSGRAGGVVRCPRPVEFIVENVNGWETVPCCRKCVRWVSVAGGKVGLAVREQMQRAATEAA